MSPEVLAGLAGVAVLLLVMLLGLLAFKANKAGEAEAAAERDQGAAVLGGGRAGGRMGRGGLRQRANRRAQQQEEEGDGSEEDEDERDYANMTRAERRAAEREDRRAAREDARQVVQQAQEARDAKRQAYDEWRRQKEDEREAAEEAALEELKRAEEERLKREEAEAAKWMHMIAVEGEGQDADEEGADGQGLLSQFIAYIKGAKAVELDELASEFRMSTADVIQRITALEEAGELTGVMDDRGKFICISRDEMASVAQFITSRGRISIAELAAKSNTFIDLDTRKVEREGGAADRMDDLDLDLDVEE